MRVLLRCDATPETGVGHLVRCLALAEAAEHRGWEPILAGSIDVPFARRIVDASKVRVTPATGVDADVLARLARDHDAQVLHVDNYDAPPNLRWTLNRVGALLSSTEDGEFGRRPADVVIDPNLGAQDRERTDDGSAVVLRGVRYAPLRQSVLRARQSARPSPASEVGSPPAVLVVMGGTDAIGLTAAVVAACAATAAPVVEVSVVAPEDQWASVRSAWDRPEPLGLLAPVDDLPRLAVRHDLVVSAAGSTTWELAHLGLPMALVAVVANQLIGYQDAVSAGIAVGLGSGHDLATDPGPASRVLKSLLTDRQLRARLSREGPRLVDGAGARRIVSRWERCAASRP